MIIADTAEDDSIARWVAARLPDFTLNPYRGEDGKRFYSAIGWLDSSGKFVAGVIYDNLRRPNVDLHIATVPGSMWCRPEFLREIFRYAFEQLGCSRATGKTPAKNQASRRMQEALGFRLEGIVREACDDGGDLCIYGMLARECRWLREKNEQGRKRTGTG
jgi:RimJ/RimL family protein N-acetyltransferase